MSVYVDPLLNHGLKLGFLCRMYALPGHLAELHEIADDIGIKRAQFQEDEPVPHYALNEVARARAVRFGAVDLPSLRDTIEHAKMWDEERKIANRDLFSL